AVLLPRFETPLLDRPRGGAVEDTRRTAGDNLRIADRPVDADGELHFHPALLATTHGFARIVRIDAAEQSRLTHRRRCGRCCRRGRGGGRRRRGGGGGGRCRRRWGCPRRRRRRRGQAGQIGGRLGSRGRCRCRRRLVRHRRTGSGCGGLCLLPLLRGGLGGGGVLTGAVDALAQVDDGKGVGIGHGEHVGQAAGI